MTPEAPPDTRPGALVRGGLRRGSLLVCLPVVLAGQAIAWIAYAISGAYHPWSWVKIGLAYALASARVPFDVTGRGFETLSAEPPASHASLILALGGLTVMALVLAFRAGGQQARGLERRPRAALAGSLVGPGFALPLGLASFLVILQFPNFGIARLEPVHWASVVLPLVLAGVAGAVGGLAGARGALEDTGGWRATLTGAVRAGATALWLALAFAFLGFLVVAAVQTDATRAYAHMVGSGAGGAVGLLHHVLLLPNQSVMILASAMGGRTDLVLGPHESVRITIGGVSAGARVLRPLAVAFPGWFWAFVLVPAASTVLGGRQAASGVRGRREALARAALAALVYAVGCGLLAWAAAVTLPIGVGVVPAPTLGPPPIATALIALPWGLAGMVGGAWWWQRRAAIAAARPR